MRIAALAVGTLSLAVSGPALADVDRAVRNYQAVVNGTRPLAQLSPEEVRELVELDARLREQALDLRTPRQRHALPVSERSTPKTAGRVAIGRT